MNKFTKLPTSPPTHNPIAKGTLNDILTKVSVWNQVPKEKLLELL